MKPASTHPWRVFLKNVVKEKQWRKIRAKLTSRAVRAAVVRVPYTRDEIIRGAKHPKQAAPIKACHCPNCILRRRKGRIA